MEKPCINIVEKSGSLSAAGYVVLYSHFCLLKYNEQEGSAQIGEENKTGT